MIIFSLLFWKSVIKNKERFVNNNIIAFLDDIPLVFDNKEDALKLLKLHKQARFKSFTSKKDAENFSLQSVSSEPIGTPNPSLSPLEDEGISFFKKF